MLGSGQHHRLLVRPDAFHVSTLFQPTLAFLDRVAEVLPSGLEAARASSTVLDEFVLRVYLPQLEEKVSFLFHQALSGQWFSMRVGVYLNELCRPRGIPTRSCIVTTVGHTAHKGRGLSGPYEI